MLNTLLMPAVLKTALSIVTAILILLATITVHEFGHYIVGKLLKFKINEFAIGMGPAIYKKTKKNGEIFSIRIFPLGGYCAFEGEDQDDETVKKANEKAALKNKKLADKPVNDVFSEEYPDTKTQDNEKPLPKKELSENAFNRKKPWQRILVLIAGATFNFIVAVLITVIYFTAYGHFAFMAYEVRTDGNNIEQSMSLENKDIIMSIDGRFLYFTTDIPKALNGKHAGDQVTVTVQHDNGKREDVKVVLRNDVEVSDMSDIYSSLQALGIASVLKVSTEEGCKIPTDTYIFRFNDAEEYKDCTRIYDLDGLYSRLKNLAPNESIELYAPAENAESGHTIFTLTAPIDYEVIDKQDRTAVLAAFGINDKEEFSYQVSSENIRFGFFEAIGRAVVYSIKTVGVTLESFWQLITGKLSLKTVSGPVGTITLTSQYVSLGFKYILNIASLIGMSVAIFNLLPIPALDGARAVFVIIEWIRKKPINRNVEGMIHFIGLVVLIGFAVLVDVLKLF